MKTEIQRKKALLISGGSPSILPDAALFDLIIAVDKGLDYALQQEIVPDVLIGDLDSLDTALSCFHAGLPAQQCGTRPAETHASCFPDVETHASCFPDAEGYRGRKGLSVFATETAETASIRLTEEKTTTVIRLYKRKDDPDTLAAVRYALENGCTDLTFCCIMGGRLDHMLSNLQTAAFAADHNATAHLLGDTEEIHVLKNASLSVPIKEGWSLSVFSLSDRCLGVSMTGTLYPAKDLLLTNTVPLGLSNEWLSDSAVISVSEGILAVALSKLS